MRILDYDGHIQFLLECRRRNPYINTIVNGTAYRVLSECYVPEKEFIKLLGELGTDRLRIRIRMERGRLTDIVIQYEAFIKEKWTAIVRYDTSHGYPHRDVLHLKGTQDKHSLSFPDLKSFLQYAEQDLKDRWEWYKERFLMEAD